MGRGRILIIHIWRSDSAGIGDNEDSSSGVGSKVRESMDATEILRIFQDHDFGAVEINELHLSQRRAVRYVCPFLA